MQVYQSRDWTYLYPLQISDVIFYFVESLLRRYIEIVLLQ